MKTYYLYYLIDPDTNVVRYVGITYRPEQRYKEHLTDAKELKTHKDNWINKLLINNKKPIFKIILQTQNKDEILEYEIKHITDNNDLTNSTTGGEYFTFTPDVINKLKEKNKGSNNPCYQRIWTEEEKHNLSLAHLGEKHTTDWNKNIALSAKNRREIVINGITYYSLKEAMRKLKIGFRTIKKLCLESL
ncbi:MAG: GIY-YIG nuclease family protein [Candidatus Paceibacterota bacterium]|jgi:predicted GIY-YIG superfamily endonuclease